MKSYETTRTRTRSVATHREVREAMRRAPLTREEELVLRMRHGISEPRSTELEFVVPTSPAVAAELEAIEGRAVARALPREEGGLAGAELKASIIEKLKNL